MSKHTPGPLRVEGTYLVDDIAQEPLLHAVIRDSTERWVALVEITDDEGQANAHLIAAAPAMYEALQAAYKLLREWTPSGEDNQGEVEGLIENALAQAEGR